MDPHSRDDLVGALASIFPDFRAVWSAEEEAPFRSGSLHSVYLAFLPFAVEANATPAQLRRLAAVLNGAVAAGGDAENAVATCFFEALGPGPLLRTLRPLLTAQSRARLRP